MKGPEKRIVGYFGRLFGPPECVWADWYHGPKALVLLKLSRMRRRLNRRNIFV